MEASRRDRVLSTHLLRDKLSLSDPVFQKMCDLYFQSQLSMDLPENSADVTSESVLSSDKEVRAEFIVKQDGIIAGTEEVLWFLRRRAGITDAFSDCIDGEFVKRNRRCLFVKGGAPAILRLERAMLNLLQRMSGIATFAYEVAHDAAQINPYVLICPTRKTLCGPLDKKAAMLGECGTHRVYLSDAILLKENHFAVCGNDLDSVLSRALNPQGPISFIEVETETSKQALQAAELILELKKARNLSTAMGIMFDNFTAVDVKRSIQEMKHRGFYEDLFFEASGGINRANMSDYLDAGVDIISMGSLTNNVSVLDISMRISGL